VLHNASLHEKLVQKKQRDRLGQVNTRTAVHCNAMGTPFPLLPFVSKDEKKAYCRYVLGRDQVRDFHKAAEEWVDFINGMNIMPKLPSHMQTYDETFSRNARIKESIKKSASGRKMLEILNDKVTPKAASATSDGDLAQTNSITTL
jgi:hypothetical protein